ncbi:MAG: methyltransferase domain-containing protein [Armatimonadetes bacterium]|nr:methyltransferase domain-containing protein [Armatimonadota bacterium]
MEPQNYVDWMAEIDRRPDPNEVAEVIRLVCGGPDHQRMLAALFDRVPLAPGQRVLEVGCGTGEAARLLARRTGCRNPIVGVDPSATVLNVARGMTREEHLEEILDFRQMDGRALGFAGDTFSFTYCARVLQHARAPLAVLAEMARITAPGGTVLAVEQDLGGCFEAGIPDDLYRRCFQDTNPTLARELPFHFRRLGLEVLDVVPAVWVLRQPRAPVADLRADYQRQRGTVWPRVAAGIVSPPEAEAYFAALERAVAEGRFLRVTLNLATLGRKPGP